MAYVTGNRADRLSFAARLGEIKTQAAAEFAAWRVYRRTFNELQALNDRELADLGIPRSSIRRVALEAAYDKSA